MTVKVGKQKSNLRAVNVGAPQGSVLGTYIFNKATDNLEDEYAQEDTEEHDLHKGDLTFLETTAQTERAASTPERQNPLNEVPITPIQGQELPEFELLAMARNVPPALTGRIEPSWRNRPITVRKFVDDNLQIEKIQMKAHTSFRDGNTIFKNSRAVKSETMFSHISGRTLRKGLKVNAAKTNLLVASASRSYNARAHFYDSNGS